MLTGMLVLVVERWGCRGGGRPWGGWRDPEVRRGCSSSSCTCTHAQWDMWIAHQPRVSASGAGLNPPERESGHLMWKGARTCVSLRPSAWVSVVSVRFLLRPSDPTDMVVVTVLLAPLPPE